MKQPSKHTVRPTAAELVTENRQTLQGLLRDLCATNSEAKELASSIIEVVIEALTKEYSVLLVNTGTLYVKYKEARSGARNPRTGEPCIVSARKVVSLGRAPIDGRKAQTYIRRETELKMPFILPGIIQEAVNRFVKFVASVADGDKRIELRGLGVFYPKFKKAYLTRNPATGNMNMSKEKTMIGFKYSAPLHRLLNS